MVGTGSYVLVIDPKIDRPVYLQLADILRRKIESREISPSHALPSITTLVQTYGIADQTARKAAGVLRDEGLVHNVSGKGVS